MSDTVRVWLKLIVLVAGAVLAAYGSSHNWITAASSGLLAAGYFLDKGPAGITPAPAIVASQLVPLGRSFAAPVAAAAAVPLATMAPTVAAAVEPVAPDVAQVLSNPVAAAEQAVSSLIGGR